MTKRMSNNGLRGFLRARVKTLDFILSLVSNSGTILNGRVKSSIFFFLFLKPYFIFCGENGPQEGKNGSREISAERSSRLSLEVGRSFPQKKWMQGTWSLICSIIQSQLEHTKFSHCTEAWMDL